MDTAVSVELFVEILNRYVYYYDQGNETVRESSVPAETQEFPSGLQKLADHATFIPGYDEIHQRSNRAYSFEPAEQ